MNITCTYRIIFRLKELKTTKHINLLTREREKIWMTLIDIQIRKKTPYHYWNICLFWYTRHSGLIFSMVFWLQFFFFFTTNSSFTIAIGICHLFNSSFTQSIHIQHFHSANTVGYEENMASNTDIIKLYPFISTHNLSATIHISLYLYLQTV